MTVRHLRFALGLALDELQPRTLFRHAGEGGRPQLHHDAEIADGDEIAVPERRGNDGLSVEIEGRRPDGT